MCPWCVELLVENTMEGIDTRLCDDGCTCRRPAHLKGVLVLDGHPGRLHERISALVADVQEREPATVNRGPLARVDTQMDNGQALMNHLITRCTWFDFEPMPEDRCHLTIKLEHKAWLCLIIKATGMDHDGSRTTVEDVTHAG